MIDTKKIGRPRTFDENQALLAAMNVFWTKGYDGASLKDLTKAMGISGPSMYAAFGDKRSLYLKTIDLYSDVDACEPILVFEAQKDLAAGVRAFLLAVIKSATEKNAGAKGCFLATCVISNVDEITGVSEKLKGAIDDTDDRLAARFDREKELGKLPADFPSRERAKLMFDFRQGYVFRGRAGWSYEALAADIDDRVKMIINY